MKVEQKFPCGDFKDLEGVAPGQDITGYFPCIFNEGVQSAQYICPAEGEYPRLCQEVYRSLKEELTAINTDIEAMLEKEKSKTEAEKRASMSLKEKVAGVFHKNDDETEEPD
jgi:hypothetical protein